jgi:hypothetical protein
VHGNPLRQSFEVVQAAPAAASATQVMLVVEQIAYGTHWVPDGQAPPTAVICKQVRLVLSQKSAAELQIPLGHGWPSAGAVPQVPEPVVGSALQIVPGAQRLEPFWHGWPAATGAIQVAVVPVVPKLQKVPSAQTVPLAVQSPPDATSAWQLPAQQVTELQLLRLQLRETHSSPLKQAPPLATVPVAIASQVF